MDTPAPTLCFTCGLAVEETPRLNRLTNGEICPACRDRVLDMLPAPLPSRPGEVRAGTMGLASDAPFKS